ncbi:hypothetical protein Bhyg_13471 [Pseudolycoriella hygida]|uniref:Uncharacterized protein n=1 Tax=Pseudolycoriella hygida TaxID=35572 RepID=A0A9Q0MPP0_9DIPT|nr:hypothetical protein Bhyg_13471 [Pseudolycoriella hygida]
MMNIVQLIFSCEDPPITSEDERIIFDKRSRNEQSSHGRRRKDKSIPKTIQNNKNLTEMTTNRRTQSSNDDKQDNCLHWENWSSKCMDEFSCSFKSNHEHPDEPSSIDTFYQNDCKHLTSKHQQNRISQSSNNEKSALTQCKSKTISSSNNKCKNRNENLALKLIQYFEAVNKRWIRWHIPVVLSQTSIILLCGIVLLLGARVADAMTKDGSK